MPRHSRALERLNQLAETTAPDLRETLGRALVASSNEKERAVGKILLSSKSSCTKLSIAGACHQHGVTHGQAMTALKMFKRLETIVNVANEMPQIGLDIAEDAKNRLVTCSSCEGSGHVIVSKDIETGVEVTKLCIPCEGSGKVIRHGDPTARKQALEIMELSGRAITTINAPGSNMVVASGEGSLEEMLKATRQQGNAGGSNGRSTNGTNEILEGTGAATMARDNGADTTAEYVEGDED